MVHEFAAKVFVSLAVSCLEIFCYWRFNYLYYVIGTEVPES
jgi:hypothetical protein